MGNCNNVNCLIARSFAFLEILECGVPTDYIVMSSMCFAIGHIWSRLSSDTHCFLFRVRFPSIYLCFCEHCYGSYSCAHFNHIGSVICMLTLLLHIFVRHFSTISIVWFVSEFGYWTHLRATLQQHQLLDLSLLHFVIEPSCATFQQHKLGDVALHWGFPTYSFAACRQHICILLLNMFARKFPPTYVLQCLLDVLGLCARVANNINCLICLFILVLNISERNLQERK